MKSYPVYKDSGVEWLGEIPAGWGVLHLRRFLAAVFNGTTATQVEQSDDTVPVTRIETISDGTINTEKTGHISRLEAPDQMRLIKGDILFSHINSLSMIGNSALFDGRTELYAGMNLLTLRPNQTIQPAYLHWMLQSSDLRRFISSLAKPAINQSSLPQSLLLNIQLPNAPLSEQRKIAAFLDLEVAKIDDLIEEQRRLIALLAEKRQATISHAVTKGLNPNAKLKPSGIDWLGDVPEAWDVVRAKDVAQIYVPQRNKPDLNEAGDGLPWVTMESMRSEYIANPMLWVSQGAAKDAGSSALPTNSVIASCVGNFGVAAINSTEVIINQQLQAYIPNSLLLPRFLRFVVSVSQVYFDQVATSSVIRYVNQIGFGMLPVPLPPLSAQMEIVDHLSKAVQKIDSLSNEVEDAINLLQERRSALISAAVTGKIDLRDFDDSILA